MLICFLFKIWSKCLNILEKLLRLFFLNLVRNKDIFVWFWSYSWNLIFRVRVLCFEDLFAFFLMKSFYLIFFVHQWTLILWDYLQQFSNFIVFLLNLKTMSFIDFSNLDFMITFMGSYNSNFMTVMNCFWSWSLRLMNFLSQFSWANYIVLMWPLWAYHRSF